MSKTVALKWLDWLIRGFFVLVLSIVVLVLATLVILAVLVAFKMLIAAYSADGGSTENTTLALSSLGLGALVVALLSAPLIIWRSWIAHQDYKVNKQGHITDRINKAVENLGAHKTNKDSETIPNLEVRIGGIFALERIAQDSPRDHIQIMEILSAYIRKNAPVSAALSAEELHDNPFTAPRVDVQTALTVIGRRKPRQIKLEEREKYYIDLQRTALQGASLSRLNISRVLFHYSNLAGANLIRTTLIGTPEYQKIWGVCFNGAKFTWCTIKNLEFPDTTLSCADFMRASFQDVKLSTINQEAMLKSSTIVHAFGDASVILPEGMERPKHWPNQVLGNKFEAEYKKWLKDPKSYTPPKS